MVSLGKGGDGDLKEPLVARVRRVFVKSPFENPLGPRRREETPHLFKKKGGIPNLPMRCDMTGRFSCLSFDGRQRRSDGVTQKKEADTGATGRLKDSCLLSFTAVLITAFVVISAMPLHAASDEYDSLTGEPNCVKCHTLDRRYSIDYTRDETCTECHGAGVSDKFNAINSRFTNQFAENEMAGVKADSVSEGVTEQAKTSKPAKPDAGKSETDKTNPPPAPSFSKGGSGQPTIEKEGSGQSTQSAFTGAGASKAGGGAASEMKAMVIVPAGEFTMGSDDWWPKSQPRHKRRLKAFYIDKFEVTNLRYKGFVDATGYKTPDHWLGGRIPNGKENHPVVFVDWDDAQAFCKWEGKRLPAEDEWEKAARGTDARAFPWGDKFAKEKGNTPQYDHKGTMPVGSFENGKSPYGVYDMAGNVWEWTADWFTQYPGNKHPDENYGMKFKSVRGGSWYDCTYYKCGISAPAYNRIFFHPKTKNNNFGIRCAKDAR